MLSLPRDRQPAGACVVTPLRRISPIASKKSVRRASVGLVAAASCFVLASALARANYYDTVEDGTLSNLTLYSQICTTKLWVWHTTSDFVDQDMWDDVNPSGPFWTEAGIVIGYNSYGGASFPQFFWADRNVRYGYNQHFSGINPVGGGEYDDWIQYDPSKGTGWWYVSVGGYDGWSYHESTYGVDVAAGMEYTNDNSGYTAASGSNRSLAYWDTSGVRHSGWPGAYLYPEGMGEVQWVSDGIQDRIGGQPWSC